MLDNPFIHMTLLAHIKSPDGFRQIAVNDIAVRTMNAGQPWRSPDMPEIAYQISISLDDALPFLENFYDEWKDDLIKYPDPTHEDDLDKAIIAHHYPTSVISMLEDLKSYDNLIRLLLDAAAIDMLQHVFLKEKGQQDRVAQYAINTIDTIEFNAKEIQLSGIARNGIPDNLAIQDF